MLPGYYQRFIKNYAQIAHSSIELFFFFSKDSFSWSKGAHNAFENLKIAMTNTPVLSLPDFSETFIFQTCIGHKIGSNTSSMANQPSFSTKSFVTNLKMHRHMLGNCMPSQHQ